jgi:ribosomal protein S18 acetylase RimI-like enzyme
VIRVIAPARPHAPPVDLLWPTRAQVLSDDRVRADVHRVVSSGSAVRSTEVDRAGSDDWLHDILDRGARLALARLAGRVEALGRWERYETRADQCNGHIRQVMTHPDARRRGLARSVVHALVDDARAAGVQTLTLHVRGANQAAVALYTSLGFGAVGGDRYDRVLFALRLGAGPDAAGDRTESKG